MFLSSSSTTTGDAGLFLKKEERAWPLSNFSKTDVRGYDANGNPTKKLNGVSDEAR
jgi:hypothetical protein